MVTPGLFRHYKDPHYRVLFVAKWAARWPTEDARLAVFVESLAIGSQLSVGVRGELGEVYGTAIFDARWSGNGYKVAEGEDIVIYVALYGDGRLSARTMSEFEEEIQVRPGLYAPRFERIGD